MRFFFCCIVMFFQASSCLAAGFGFQEAARIYGHDSNGHEFTLFAEKLEAISWVESRHNHQAIGKNSTSQKGRFLISHDYGHMQINDHFWKKKLDEIDPTLWDRMIADPKICTMVGAWILAQCIQRYGNTWDAIAAYNTGRAIDLSDCKGDKDRVRRGAEYANKVYRYLLTRGYISPPKNQPSIETLLPHAARPRSREKASSPDSLGRPMAMRITRAEVMKFRSSGHWQRVN